MAFKILLTENQSTLGAALAKGFEDLPLSLHMPEAQANAWQNEAVALEYLQSVRPTVIVNPLALTEQTFKGEAEAAMIMARACSQLDITLIHLSSHLVFSELQNDGAALSEYDSPSPSAELGHLLFELETAVQRSPRSIVLRLPWLLDGQSGIIFQSAQRLLGSEPIEASENWRGTPVFIKDVVRVTVSIVQQILCGAENWGVFHFHSSDSCSEAEFLDYIARTLNKKNFQVAPISVTQSSQRIFEGNGWLVGNRCTNCFGVQYRSWRQGTKGRLEAWLKKNPASGSIKRPEQLEAKSKQLRSQR